MNWLLLIVGGLFEVGFATCIGKAKENTGSAAIIWLIGFLICLTISMLLLFEASLTLLIGTAYDIWTGIGAVGTVLIGIFVFNEPTRFGGCFF